MMDRMLPEEEARQGTARTPLHRYAWPVVPCSCALTMRALSRGTFWWSTVVFPPQASPCRLALTPDAQRCLRLFKGELKITSRPL